MQCLWGGVALNLLNGLLLSLLKVNVEKFLVHFSTYALSAICGSKPPFVSFSLRCTFNFQHPGVTLRIVTVCKKKKKKRALTHAYIHWEVS